MDNSDFKMHVTVQTFVKLFCSLNLTWAINNPNRNLLLCLFIFFSVLALKPDKNSK